MNDASPSPAASGGEKQVSIKMIGIGTAGIKILEVIARRGLPGASCIAVGTHPASLVGSSATETFCLETKSSHGASRNSGRATLAGDENALKLKAACAGAEAVFLVAGLGGNAGTSIAPGLARAAREGGALVLAFVTLPFDFEGNLRTEQALHGLAQLKAEADGVVCIPNQKAFKMIDDKTSVVDTFRIMNELMAEGICGVWQLVSRQGLLEIHFADICALLRDRYGESSLATAEAAGPARSSDIVEKLMAHPMLDAGKTLADSDAVLVSLVGGPDLSMVETSRVMDAINQKCLRADVRMGAAIDERYHERLILTVIATRRGESTGTPPGPDEEAPAHGAQSLDGLENQLLNPAPTARPHSRFVPPPPSLPPEKMEQIMARQSPGPARVRRAPRLRQGQLPLEIVSKGRFDKSEPTIHRGEDLDVPTYIRRGVALN